MKNTREIIGNRGTVPLKLPTWFWAALVGNVGTILMAILLPLLGVRHAHTSLRTPPTQEAASVSQAARASEPGSAPERGAGRRRAAVENAEPAPSPERVIADKFSRFAAGRRDLFRALAARLGRSVSPDVERFFELAQHGSWEELEAAYQALQHRRAAGAEDLRSVWGAIFETFGAAETVHEWPAERLLEYGNAILGALRPGMVYVGGTDPGRFIPTLLNDTTDGERHIVLTQNALADSDYVDYLRLRYGDQLAVPTDDDVRQVFDEYLGDARRRAEHDAQFPNEPKELRPGEQVQLSEDGHTTVAGQVAVMSINDGLLKRFMQQNPALSFGLEESYALDTSYANAVPFGPILDLSAGDAPAAWMPEQAAGVVDYWRSAAAAFSTENPTSADPTRLAVAKLVAAQAQLLASHQLPSEAEQAFRLGLQICPTSPELVSRYVNLLSAQQRPQDAWSVALAAANAAPDNRQFRDLLAGLQQQTPQN